MKSRSKITNWTVYIYILFSLLVFVFILVSSIFLLSDSESDYYKSVGWSCDKSTFFDEYYTLYSEKIERLSEKYALTHERKQQIEEKDSWNIVDIYLYCEEYTVAINFADGQSLAYFNINLYYYGGSSSTEESKIELLLGFVNELTNYVAYDTITDSNQFSVLYEDASKNGKGYASNIYHFDNTVGNVGYYVGLNHEEGYYYMAEFNSDLEKSCYIFRFEGLLRSLL